MIFTWLAGLGLASKLTIGVSAVAVGVAGGGAVGVLPPVAQQTFDEVVAAVTENTEDTENTEETVSDPVAEAPIEEPADEGDGLDEGDELGEGDTDSDGSPEGIPAEELPTEEPTHGDRVSAVAQDRTLVGRDHGKAVSEVARSRGQEQRGKDRDAEDEDELEESEEAPENEVDEADTDEADTDEADTDEADTDEADTDEADTDEADTDEVDDAEEAGTAASAPAGGKGKHNR